MRHVAMTLFAGAAIAAACSATSAHAQGKTYPSYYGSTPSPSYYPMRNWYDQDTYMNPNPFPEYPARGYEERGLLNCVSTKCYPGAGAVTVWIPSVLRGCTNAGLLLRRSVRLRTLRPRGPHGLSLRLVVRQIQDARRCERERRFRSVEGEG
jgi:hypothetical protein